jgi:glycosyltransferase involved in cell wall biosynthesis
MLPSVTVVMAAFDAERFVGEAIESALAQDYRRDLVEVVVVDDGSTDATAAIARHHAMATGRVRVIGRPNGGNVAATNTGFAHAHGDVVALLDADDAWPRDKLRRAVEVLVERPEVGLVYGDMTVIDEDGEVLQESWLAGDVTPEGRCLGAQLAGNNITASSIVMRGDVLRAVAPIPPGMPWADWWLATRIAREAEIAYLAEPRTLYRFHGANMSLGAQGDARRGELVKAAGFQRHLLRTLRPGDATPVEVAAGWAAFERNVREASALGDSPFRRVLDVTDADRAEAAVLERRAGDAAAPLWPLLRAAAADPWNDAARDGLVAALAAAPRDTTARAAA